MCLSLCMSESEYIHKIAYPILVMIILFMAEIRLKRYAKLPALKILSKQKQKFADF